MYLLTYKWHYGNIRSLSGYIFLISIKSSCHTQLVNKYNPYKISKFEINPQFVAIKQKYPDINF